MIEQNVYSNLNITEDRTRAINQALLCMIDSIYLALYVKRAVFSNKSVSHILDCIYKNTTEINVISTKFKLNDVELRAFESYKVILDTILSGNMLTNGMIDCFSIKALIMRVYNSEVSAEYASLVLSIANQHRNEIPKMYVPKFYIFPGTSRYFRSIHPIDVIFKLDTNTVNGPSFQNLFQGIKPVNRNLLNTYIRNICSIIAIDILPDITNGVGLLYLPFEHAVKYNKLIVPDTESIDVNLTRSIDIRNIVIAKSVSAESVDFTDAIEAIEETSPEEEPKEEVPDEKTTPEETTDTEETPEDIDANNPDANPDNQTDDSPTDPEMETTEEKPKPQLLELATNETLDELLYKISIAKYIDNVTQFNHDEFPSETVTLLTKWKSMFLFLVTAEETKKLFSELKIKDI